MAKVIITIEDVDGRADIAAECDPPMPVSEQRTLAQQAGALALESLMRAGEGEFQIETADGNIERGEF